MRELLILCALIGTTLIVVDSTLFRPIRKLWPALLGCAQCFGFWVGAAGGGSGLLGAGHSRVLDAFVVGTATSFLSLLAYAALVNLLGEPVEDEGKDGQ
jgi:hypothetical protein